MVFNGKRHRKLSRRLVITFFTAVALAFSLSGQDSGQEGADLQDETPRAAVEISQEKIIVGQRFDLTIYADFSSYRSVRIKEPQLPEGITLASGPYKSAQTVRVGDVSDPVYIKKTRVFYKFKVSKPGIYSLDSFSLDDGETTLQTEPVIFSVLAFDERNYKYPVFARWRSIPETVYVGETFPLVLEMENLEALSFPDKVEMAAPAGGMFERVNSLGEIDVMAIGDDEVYIAPIDSWLYTPTSAGTVRIPKAVVEMGAIKRVTEAASVEVLPVPDAIQETGAVGLFELSAHIENLPVGKGRISTLRVRVEGEGNLNYLVMPKPEFSGLILIEKEEINSFVPSERGYRGFREDVYRLSAGEEETMDILFSPWSWLNSDSDEVETSEIDGYHYENKNITAGGESLSRRDEYTYVDSKTILAERKPVYNVPMYYLLVIPGLVSIAAALIKKRFDMKAALYSMLVLMLVSSVSALSPAETGQLQKADGFISDGQFEEALETYATLLPGAEDNSALFYNMALLNYDLGEKGQSVYFLRRALALKPGNGMYRGALEMMEEELGLEHQVRATTGLSPDLFFLLFILLFNAGSFIVTLNIRKRKMELSILISMIFLLSFMSLLTVFYSDFVSRSDTAVVASPGGELKKVPGNLGGPWLTLQEGSAVQIVSRSGESVLIRTGYGLEGWLDMGALLVLQEAE